MNVTALKVVNHMVETSFLKAMDAKKRRSHVLPLSINIFFPDFDFFLVPPLPYLSDMPTSFCDKVLVLKYKIECEGSSTFGEALYYLT